MGDRYGRKVGGGYREIKGDRRGDIRVACPICGRPYGAFHEAARCADEWIRRCDAEARKLKEGTQP